MRRLRRSPSRHLVVLAPLWLLVLVVALALQVVAVVDNDGTPSNSSAVVAIGSRGPIRTRKEEPLLPSPPLRRLRPLARAWAFLVGRRSSSPWDAGVHPSRGP
jgi:hypothetical protein